MIQRAKAMTFNADQNAEELAELLATGWSALVARLGQKGFSRLEAMTLLVAYVFASQLSIDVAGAEAEDD